MKHSDEFTKLVYDLAHKAMKKSSLDESSLHEQWEETMMNFARLVAEECLNLIRKNKINTLYDDPCLINPDVFFDIKTRFDL